MFAFLLWGLVYVSLASIGWEHWLLTSLLFVCGYLTARYLWTLIGMRVAGLRFRVRSQDAGSFTVNAIHQYWIEASGKIEIHRVYEPTLSTFWVAPQHSKLLISSLSTRLVFATTASEYVAIRRDFIAA